MSLVLYYSTVIIIIPITAAAIVITVCLKGGVLVGLFVHHWRPSEWRRWLTRKQIQANARLDPLPKVIDSLT